jgi:hypothetical protein
MPSAVMTCSRDTGAMCVEKTTVCPMLKALSAAASGIPRVSPMRHRELVNELIRALAQDRRGGRGEAPFTLL